MTSSMQKENKQEIIHLTIGLCCQSRSIREESLFRRTDAILCLYHIVSNFETLGHSGMLGLISLKNKMLSLTLSNALLKSRKAVSTVDNPAV